VPLGRAHALFERESELTELAALLDSARGGRGGLVVVEGPAGIGKTRLLGAVRDAAGERGVESLAARGGELERELPFGVVRQLFERRLHRAAARERERLLEGPAGLSSSVLLNGAGDGGAGGVGGRSHAVLHGLYWLTSNLAERGPLLLCVDDAHWADAASLGFLHYLARRVDDLPLLLVVTLRPADAGSQGEPVARLRGEPLATVLRPAPLSRGAVSDLVRARLGAAAAPEFCEACHTATRGNPFLAHELLGELEAVGIPPSAGEAPKVSRLVPDAVARQALGRLARLPAEATALARAVALLGSDVELRLAGRLAGLDYRAAADAADALARAELLRPGVALEFAHPLLREAIYADLAVGERSRAHTRAARLLHEGGAARDRVAAQLLAGPPVGEEWALGALRAAASDALARGAPASAAAYLRRALEEPLTADQRRTVLHELGSAEVQAWGPDGTHHLRAALDLSDDGDEHAGLARELALALVQYLRQPDAVGVLTGELNGAGGVGPELRLQLEADLASTLLFGMDEALTELDARLDRAAGGASPETAPGRGLLAALAWRLVQRGESAADAAAIAGQVLDHGLLEDVGPGSTTYFSAIMALACSGALEHARRHVDEALRRSQGSGFALGVALNFNLLSWIAHRRGAIAEAEATAADSLRVIREHDIPLGHPAAISSLVEALVAIGDRRSAWQELERDHFTGELPDIFTSAFLLESRGRLRALGGDHVGAVADLRGAGERFRRWGVTGPEPSGWRAYAAEQLAVLGRHDEAAQLAGEELELAGRFGAPRPLGRALRVTGLVAGATAGVQSLRDAIDVLEPSPARLELAQAHFELGSALRRRGEREASRDPLRRAMQIAHECGARALEERAHQELLASGARPRRRQVSGVDALTPSERRVAGLAAEGLSNREIAQSLFVSLKTVEMHLSRAYRKLDLKSRTELPAIARK
jgi:DNA-binding CsgD family transcriptional regulator